MHTMGKKRTTITIDKESLDFARHLGLNLSGFLEERLKDLQNNFEWVHRDLNPGPPPCEGDVITN